MRLRPEIESSWRRTASAGLDPGSSVGTEDVADYDPASRLRRAAGPVLDGVAEQLAGLRYGLVLADHESRIVDSRFGQSRLHDRLCALGAVPGKAFTEATTGTNSIATAFETRQGIAVRGEEHYLEAFKGLACFGMPIRDPVTRRHVGVLDITCPVEEDAPLLRPFLAGAVDEVEAALLQNAPHSHQRVLRAFEAARVRAHGPLLVLGPDLVLSNDAAAGMLEPRDHATLQTLADDPPRVGRVEVDLACGARVGAEFERVDAGAVLVRLEPTVPRAAIPRRGAPSSATDDWHADLAVELATHARRRASVIVRGEAGTGRSTMARRLADLDEVVTLSCPLLPGADVRALCGPDGTTTVIDDADLLTTDQVASIARRVDAESRRLILVLGTGGEEPLRLTARCPVRLDMAPVRSARDRIPAFAAATLRTRSDGACRFTATTLRLLAAQDWPGNLREFAAVVDHVLTEVSAGDVTPADLPAAYRQPGRTDGALRQAERDTIVRALERCSGNKVHAARELGISRNTLYRRVRELRIDLDGIRRRSTT